MANENNNTLITSESLPKHIKSYFGFKSNKDLINYLNYMQQRHEVMNKYVKPFPELIDEITDPRTLDMEKSLNQAVKVLRKGHDPKITVNRGPQNARDIFYQPYAPLRFSGFLPDKLLDPAIYITNKKTLSDNLQTPFNLSYNLLNNIKDLTETDPKFHELNHAWHNFIYPKTESQNYKDDLPNYNSARLREKFLEKPNTIVSTEQKPRPFAKKFPGPINYYIDNPLELKQIGMLMTNIRKKLGEKHLGNKDHIAAMHREREFVDNLIETKNEEDILKKLGLTGSDPESKSRQIETLRAIRALRALKYPNNKYKYYYGDPNKFSTHLEKFFHKLQPSEDLESPYRIMDSSKKENDPRQLRQLYDELLRSILPRLATKANTRNKYQI